MSETTEPDGKPEPGTGPSGVPDTPAPPAPESTPPETDEPVPAREAEEREKEDRRTAPLRARLGAMERENARKDVELEFYRRQVQQQAPAEDTPEQAAQRLRMQVRAEVEAEIKVKNLHAEGYAQFPDWDERRNKVVNMGGDAEFANLIVDMPPREAVRVVAALAEDPDALMRIVDLKGERARAVALGKYAATIEDAPPARGNGHSHATPTPQMTRAPAPIRPVTGRANPQFNEYTASGDQLVDVYLKRDLERARGGSRR